MFIPDIPDTFWGASGTLLDTAGVNWTIDDATEYETLTNAFTENSYVCKFVNPVIVLLVTFPGTLTVVILNGVAIF